MADDALLDLEDRLQGQGGRQSSGRSHRGGRNQRRGGGTSGQSRDVQASKALSKLLRHQAENAGIKLDDEGFAPLDRVLGYGPIKSMKLSLEEVESIVSGNEKQRFSLKPDPATNPSLSTSSREPSHYLIRANQGHSIKLDSSAHLKPITLEEGNLPARALHGTYFAFWPAILESGGLRAMSRNHVHCATSTSDGNAVSGMRKSVELVVEIDVERSIRDGGLKWWLSDNGVVLTEGDEEGLVKTEFFKVVTGSKANVGEIWRDGREVARLPAGLKSNPPPGIGSRGRGGGNHRTGGLGS